MNIYRLKAIIITFFCCLYSHILVLTVYISTFFPISEESLFIFVYFAIYFFLPVRGPAP